MNQLTEQEPALVVEAPSPSDWQSGELLDFLELQRGVDLPVQDRRGGNVPIFGSNGLLGFHDVSVSEGPGVITGRSGTIGKVFYSQGEYWPLNTSLYVKDFKGNLPKFIYYKLGAIGLERFSTGTGVPTLNRNVAHKESVAFPPLHEQQKIAAILTAVDDKLDVIARQIEATQTLKQGLMQTLFSRGVGTQDADGHWVPHTEFRDSELGEIPAGWECLRLGDVLAEKPEYGANASAVPFDAENRIRYLRITDIDEHGRLRSDSIKAIPSDEARDYILADGDLLIARSGNTVGKSILYKSAMGLCAFAGYLLRFRFGSKVLVDFVAEYLTSDTYWAWIKASVKVGAQPNINAQQYQAMFIPVPPTEEQQRIAAVLAGVDAKIELLRARQTQFQNLKRGLMQKLLTGEWRVSVDASAAGT